MKQWVLSAGDKLALELFRAKNPDSRAEGWVTVYGSGSKIRRHSCVACGTLITTTSADYPVTVTAEREIAEHIATCPEIAEYRKLAAYVARMRKTHEDVSPHCVDSRTGIRLRLRATLLRQGFRPEFADRFLPSITTPCG